MKGEATGRIVQMLSDHVGTLRDGKLWNSREYLMEGDDRFKRKMKFTMISYGGMIEDAPAVGERVTVRFIVEAREYGGKWYNYVNAYQVRREPCTSE